MFAFVRFCSIVSSLMTANQMSTFERFSTLVTGEWRFQTVSCVVTSQTRCTDQIHMTKVTLVQEVSTVVSLVSVPMVGQPERLWALVTRIWLFSSVNSDVSFKTPFICEGFLTFFAGDISMMSFMSIETSQVCEFYVTKKT